MIVCLMLTVWYEAVDNSAATFTFEDDWLLHFNWKLT
jgi:hypothetical protein